MSETLGTGVHQMKWPAKSIIHDLEIQGGFSGVTLDGDYVSPSRLLIEGETQDGTGFVMAWAKGRMFILTMINLPDEVEAHMADFEKLVEAFSKILGYQPFCHYQRDDDLTINGSLTYEWNVDPESRMIELGSDKKAQGCIHWLN